MEHIDTIVIGGGQAGLSTGYHLKRRNIPFMILESRGHIGDGWRRHWDSLRLFTPGRFSSLPGLPTPVGRGGFATKDEFAGYLESYARRFELPIRLGVTVTAVTTTDHGFELATTAGPMSARHVVVASGPNRVPRVPGFASQLDPGIRQLHSSEYRNPQGIPPATCSWSAPAPEGRRSRSSSLPPTASSSPAARRPTSPTRCSASPVPRTGSS